MDLVLSILNLVSGLISIGNLNISGIECWQFMWLKSESGLWSWMVRTGIKRIPDGLLQIWPFSSKISPMLLPDFSALLSFNHSSFKVNVSVSWFMGYSSKLFLGSTLISSSKSFAIFIRQLTKPRSPKIYIFNQIGIRAMVELKPGFGQDSYKKMILSSIANHVKNQNKKLMHWLPAL